MNIVTGIGMLAILVLTVIVFAIQGVWLGTSLLIIALLVGIFGIVLTVTVGRNMELAGLVYMMYGWILAGIIAGIGVILIVLRFTAENHTYLRPYLGL